MVHQLNMRDLVIQKVKHQTTFGAWFLCVLFKWDTSAQRLTLHSQQRQNLVRFFLVLNGFYVLLQCGSILWKKMGTVEKAQSVFFTTLYLICVMLWWSWHPDPAIMTLLNCITSQKVVNGNDIISNTLQIN